MDNIHARIVQKLDEILIALNLAPAPLCRLKTSLNARSVAVRQAHKARTAERKMVGAMRDAAKADKCTRKLIGRSRSTPENLSRNEIERTNRGRSFKEVPSCRCIHLTTFF